MKIDELPESETRWCETCRKDTEWVKAGAMHPADADPAAGVWMTYECRDCAAGSGWNGDGHAR